MRSIVFLFSVAFIFKLACGLQKSKNATVNGARRWLVRSVPTTSLCNPRQTPGDSQPPPAVAPVKLLRPDIVSFSLPAPVSQDAKMINTFFEQPILNSPYAYPGRHWELDADGQPTNKIADTRRRSAFITPVPKPKKRRQADAAKQVDLVFPEAEKISTTEQQYDPNTIINEIRGYVDQWRGFPIPTSGKSARKPPGF